MKTIFKILLSASFCFNLYAETLPVLDNFHGEYTKMSTHLHDQKKLFFQSTAADINSGDALISGNVEHINKWNKISLDKIEKIDQAMDHILSKDSSYPSYNYLFFSNQVYLLKNVHPDQFLNGDEIFRVDTYRQTVYKDLDLQVAHPKEDFSYTIFRPLNGIIGGDLVSKVHHRKIEREDLNQHQRDVFEEVTHFGVPDRVAITTLRTPKKAGRRKFDFSNKDHSFFRGSSSITLYYSVNNNQDTLVQTFQIGKMKMNSIKGAMCKGLYSMASNLFTGGIKTSIQNTRLYFDKSNVN